MPSITANLSLNKGSHGDWLNFWEIPINQNWDILDALFDAATGHAHSGVAGDGPAIDHGDLDNAGVLSHAQLDVAADKAKVSAGDITANYLESKVQAGVNVVITKQNPGANEHLEIAVPVVTATWSDDDTYGDKPAVPTGAPVAYSDNFNWPMGFSLRNAGYVTETQPSPASFDFISTGYSAVMFFNPAGGDPLSGVWNAVTSCHLPHSPAQRATLSITDFDEPTEIGDAICFTLGVYATQRVGSHLPQRHGVFLEIHATCIAPGVYQVSHRVVVLPDDLTRVEFPACIHANIEDIKGCWELSLDQHGHVYVYWRRNMVFTTQTSPVSTPGPVKAYFPTLTASLQAAGEPPYGSIGYGLRYFLSPYSTMAVEIRWFTAAATDDLYHEVAACAGTPLVGPELPEYPEEFMTEPAGDGAAGIAGTTCCSSPDIRKVGEVLSWNAGVPSVWILACGMHEGVSSDGYLTNVSEVVTPCAFLVDGGVTFNFMSGVTPWQESLDGSVLISGILNVMPSVMVTSSVAGMTIDRVTRMSETSLLVEYSIADGVGGQTPSLTISDKYRPANTLTIVAPVISIVPLAHTSVVFSLKYDDTPAVGLLEGLQLSYVMTVRGAKPAVVVSSLTPGVTVSSTYISPTRIVGDIKLILQANPPGVTAVVLNVTNGGPGIDVTVPVVEALPLLSHVDADTNAANTTPVNVSIIGNLFRSGCTVVVSAGDFTITSFTRVNDTLITVVGLTGPGAVPNVEFTVSNGPGLAVPVPIMTIGVPAPMFAAATPSPQAAVQGTLVNISGNQFFNSTYITIAAGIGTDPLAPYANNGNVHVVARNINNFDVVIDPLLVDGSNPVNVWLTNPGAPPLLVAPMFTVAPTLAPSALAIFPATVKPGETIIGATITGVDINEYTALSTPSAFLAITNVVSVLGTITFDVTIDTAAPPSSLQAISADNPGSLSTSINLSVTERDPILHTVDCEHPYHGRQDQLIVLRGEHLFVGGVLTAVAGCTLDSFTRISDSEVQAIVDLQVAANAQLQWTNPAGGMSVISLPLSAEPVPEISHTSVLCAQEGAINQDMYVYGRRLDPTNTGPSIALAGANLLSVVLWTDSFIHLKVTVTGIAGTNITAAITGSVAYPSFYVATILAGAPAPAVTSITFAPTDPPEEATTSTITITGTGLLNVATIEVWPAVPRLGPDYLPFGLSFPGNIVITAQSDTQIVGTITIGAALVPWALDLRFFDAGAALIYTAASAITPTPFSGLPFPAPVFAAPAILDTIVEIPGIPQSIVFAMVDAVGLYPGETWTGDNVTITGMLPAFPGLNDWTIDFFITAPGPYALYCYRSVIMNDDRCTAVGPLGTA